MTIHPRSPRDTGWDIAAAMVLGAVLVLAVLAVASLLHP